MRPVMRASQAFAALLGLASVGFVLFAFVQQATDFGSLVLVAAGGVLSFLAIPAAGRMFQRTRWALVGLAGTYSVLMLWALTRQLDQERMVAVRGGLSTLLLAGLLFTLWGAYAPRPQSRRRGLHNYYD